MFTVVTDSDDFVTEYKACWVVCGNHQCLGLDYDEHYVLVVSSQSTRMFLVASIV